MGVGVCGVNVSVNAALHTHSAKEREVGKEIKGAFAGQ